MSLFIDTEEKGEEGLREANEHLTLDQILRLLRKDSGPEDRDSKKELEKHLEQCPACARLRDEYRIVMSKLEGFARAGRQTTATNCLPSHVWGEIAAGLSSAEETIRYLQHASSCPACALELETALYAIQGNTLLPQEIQQQLVTGTEKWQHAFAGQMAPRMAGSPTNVMAKPAEAISFKGRTGNFTPRRWAYAALAAGILLVLSVGFFSWMRRSSPENLICKAYTEQRTVELRIPNAAYGPIRVQRAGGQSQLNSPDALLEAETRIKRGLERTPDDPSLLQGKAEADLLNWDYQPAIETLGHALRLQPSSSYLLIDLATAYFERAEASSSPADYEAGLQCLGDAIRTAPNNPAALFNRAIIYERLYLYERATADWEQLLKIEKDAGWRKEAEQHLEQLRLKERQHSQRHVPGSLNLAQFKEDLTAHRVIGAEQRIADAGGQVTNVEEYVEAAERKILPRIAAPFAQDENYQAAVVLADVLRTSHADPFLADLLQSAENLDSRKALQFLGQSSSSNHDGHSEDAYAFAAKAIPLFQNTGNLAGVLASQFEETYALQFESQAGPCEAVAEKAAATVHQRGYALLETQLLLEQAICTNMNGQIGPAKEITQHALAVAKKHQYFSFYLRGLTLLATLESDAGNESSAWSAIQEGLGLYWKRNLPPVRAYSFYALLDRIAEHLGHPNVQFAAALEALRFRTDSSNRIVEATERMRLGNVSLQLNELQTAREQFEKARQIFAAVPQTESVRWHELEAQIYLARVQSLEGSNTNESMEKLSACLPEIQQLSNRYVEAQYYDTVAELKLKSGDTKTSQILLGSAIQVAESGLYSLRGWRERLEWMDNNRQPYIRLTELQFQSGNPEAALQLWEHFRTAGGVPLQNTVLPASIETAVATPVKTSSRVFPETRAVLTYAFGQNGLMVWVRNFQEIHSIFLTPSSTEFRRAAENFIEECARPNSDLSALHADGSYLYRLLIQPIKQWLPNTGHLVIEPDGILSLVPLEALTDEFGGYLGSRYTITMATSLAAGNSSDRSPVPIQASDRALIIAAPSEAHNGIGPPPGSPDEALRISGRFADSVLVTGQAATVSTVAKELPQSTVFHFAGHASLNRTGAAMLMADGTLGTDQVYALGTHELTKLKLAMFSACATAKPSETSDSDSLVSEFLQAGAQNVVASRWNVDSEATRDFVDLFYGFLLSGRSIADAVQAAANSFRSNQERTHPYYWAAFSAYGRV